MSRIDFSSLSNMLDSSTEFTLTEEQYKNLTGRKMPQNTEYLIRRSALAMFAKEKKLKVCVQGRTITFEKSV